MFAVADNQFQSLEKTTAWFHKNYGSKQCLFATNGQDLLLKLQKETQVIDVVFLDMRMPIMDGCSTTFYLKWHFPNIKIIGFSTITDYEMIRQAFICGVDGFIWKNEVALVLQEAIDQVVSGNYYLDNRFKNTINDDIFIKIIDHRNKFWAVIKEGLYISNEGKHTNINKREREFLILATTAMSYKEIGVVMGISEKLVQNIARGLFKKFNVADIKDLVLFALKYGFAVQANFMFVEKSCWL